MYVQPEQHELIAKGQQQQVQGYQPMPGQGYQPGPGQGYQPVPGQGYPQGPVQGYQPGPGQGYPQGQGYPPVQGYNNPQYAGQVPPQVQWMPRPQGIPGVPPGLEYLTKMSQLLVHQQVELLEMVTGMEGENKYQVKNTLGQQVYFAAEESNFCERQCCGASRGFIVHITDNMGQEVIRVTRDFKCCAGCNCCACSTCCAFEIRVEAPVGQVVGYARQLQSCTTPRYSVMDSSQQEVLYVEGPCCVCQGPCCAWDQKFKVLAADHSQEVGKISKQWTGYVKEMFTDADNFNITFPEDLDVRVKAVLVGVLFLIDFMYFEQANQNKNKHH